MYHCCCALCFVRFSFHTLLVICVYILVLSTVVVVLPPPPHPSPPQIPPPRHRSLPHLRCMPHWPEAWSICSELAQTLPAAPRGSINGMIRFGKPRTCQQLANMPPTTERAEGLVRVGRGKPLPSKSDRRGRVLMRSDWGSTRLEGRLLLRFRAQPQRRF